MLEVIGATAQHEELPPTLRAHAAFALARYNAASRERESWPRSLDDGLVDLGKASINTLSVGSQLTQIHNRRRNEIVTKVLKLCNVDAAGQAGIRRARARVRQDQPEEPPIYHVYALLYFVCVHLREKVLRLAVCAFASRQGRAWRQMNPGKVRHLNELCKYHSTEDSLPLSKDFQYVYIYESGAGTMREVSQGLPRLLL